MRVPVILMIFCGLVGCHHRMKVISNPEGAKIYRNDDYLGTTPYEIDVWSLPFRKDELRLSLSGHQSVVIGLQYPFYRLSEDLIGFRLGRVFGFVPNEQRVILFQESSP